MKKICISIVFLLNSLVFTFASFSQQANSIEALASYFAEKLSVKPDPKIAVLGFSATGGTTSDQIILVQERLITALVNTGKANVLERGKLSSLLQEKELEQSGLIEAKGAGVVGKLLQVDFLLTGTLSARGKDKFEINARLVETVSGKILSARNTVIELQNLSGNDPVAYKTGRSLGRPLVQMAILLDTSSSMDGLIMQAKTQLWKIVNDLAKAEQKGKNPQIEVAIYEYGNSAIADSEKYIRQVLPFTSDLDLVSEKLFALKTNGGDEFCGAVIKSALEGLQWKDYDDVYKVIFIAGNEPFTQGPVDYKSSIMAAVKRGIFVNTIFCGSRQEGMGSGWQSASVLGGGEYNYIEQNAIVQAVASPFDEEIRKLGIEYNKTAIPMGRKGKSAHARQKVQDENAAVAASSGADVERAVTKSQKQYSESASWDAVVLQEGGNFNADKVEKEELPAEYRNYDKKQLENVVKEKAKERKAIQQKITALNEKRNKYINEERKKSAVSNNTFDSAMQKTIRNQAQRKAFKFQ